MFDNPWKQNGCVRTFEVPEPFELKPCVREFDVPPGEVDDGEAIDEVMRDVDRDLKLVEKLIACGQTVKITENCYIDPDGTMKTTKPHYKVMFCTCGNWVRGAVVWRCEGTDPLKTYIQRR